ncbi:MAG: cysteine desulfurase [Actinobacteria bacterium]|nr:cysteine desulfurase [Actinomycetota bacterium]
MVATYLDHAATTPMRKSAIDAMVPFQDVTYANPSGSHRFAREARKAIDEARDDVASVIGCKPGEVIFTSGGTEGDNAAIIGAIAKHGGIAVCSKAEHHAVLHCVEHHGGLVVETTNTGTIDLDDLERALTTSKEKVSVVSVMAVNNEVGSITPMREVARIVREHAPDAVLHTDAVQAACWVDLSEISPLVDVLTLSSHKFGGPKGMGVMMQRTGIALEPLILGGGQERDRRSGTHNVAGIVATAVALRETAATRVEETERVTKLRDRLVDDIRAQVGDCLETVPRDERVPGIAHLCFADIENESLLFLLDEKDVFASAASACASGAMEPSHVLAAMGIERRWSKGSLRMSLGHTTTDADVDHAIRVVVGAVQHLRS